MQPQDSGNQPTKPYFDIGAGTPTRNIPLMENLNQRVSTLRTAQIQSLTFNSMPGITQAEELEMRIADRLMLGPMDPSWREGLSEADTQREEVIEQVLRDTYDRSFEAWLEWARPYATDADSFDKDFSLAWQRIALIISAFRGR
jgi:hypothetical protein